MLMRTIKYFITYLAFVKIINLEIFIRYTKLNIIKMNIRLLSKILKQSYKRLFLVKYFVATKKNSQKRRKKEKKSKQIITRL